MIFCSLILFNRKKTFKLIMQQNLKIKINSLKIIFSIGSLVKLRLQQSNLICYMLLRPILYRFAVKSKASKTYYQILELNPSAGQKQIKAHYIKLAKIYHPDVYKGSDKQRFQQIKTAFDTLSNRQKRKQYDRSIGLRQKEDHEKMQGFEEQTRQKEEAVYQKFKKKPRVKLDYSFSKSQSETIDLDQKYNQFFRKKVQTPFEEIRIKENQWWNMMTQQQRMRTTFTAIYNNPKHEARTLHQDSYKNILNEQIQESNRYEQEVKEREKKCQQARKVQNVKKAKRKYYFWFMLLGLFTLPIIASIATRQKLIKEEEIKILTKLNEIYDEDQEQKLKKRFKY